MERVLLALRGPAAAEAFLRSFLAREPEAAHVRANLTVNLLAQGRFAEGWLDYGSRHEIRGTLPRPNAERSLPASLSGKSVVLLPEQGLGDQLFFLRYAAALTQLGAHPAFACPRKMLRMLEGNPELRVFPSDEEAPAQLAGAIALLLGDLPGLLQRSDTPAPFPISVPPERLDAGRGLLAALGPPPYLGVTWRAGKARVPRPEFGTPELDPFSKEVDVGAFAKALRHWPGTLLVLQRKPSQEELSAFSTHAGRQAHDLSPLNETLEDMAAMLDLIDEYVGVSNTNMHIRAGLGKPARVLVPFPPEYRWMYSGEQSPWYPGFRIYRQAPSLDWGAALDELADSIAINSNT